MITVTEEQFINEICEKNIRQEDISLLLVETLIKNGMKISSAESCTKNNRYFRFIGCF